MSEVEEVVAIFGVGDHVWVPWSTIINSITIKVKTESSSSKTPIKTNKLIKYWPAFVLERHVTTKLRKVAYARIVPTSTPQNGNYFSPKYLVKLIGLNVNQVFYEKSLRSWLSFNPEPLPEISSNYEFNLPGQDISLSDIKIEKLTALYVRAVQKVSNKLKPTFDSRDYNSEITKKVTAEPAKVGSSSPVRLRIIYNKNSKESKGSINHGSNSKSKKVIQTPIYQNVTSINVNPPSRSVDVDEHEHDGHQGKPVNDETYLLKKKPNKPLENIGSDNSNDNVKQIPLNNSEMTSITNTFIKVEKDQEISHLFEISQKKRGRKSPKSPETKLDSFNPSNTINKIPSNSDIKASDMIIPTTDESSLLRRTRNGSVFGKWRASKRSRLSQESPEQNDPTLDQNSNDFISNEVLSNETNLKTSEEAPIQNGQSISINSTQNDDLSQTNDPTQQNKRKLITDIQKNRPRFSDQVNKDDTVKDPELQENEIKKRKVQDGSVKQDDIHGNNVGNKSMEINVGMHSFDISEQCNNIEQDDNNAIRSTPILNLTRMEYYKSKNECIFEIKEKPIIQSADQIQSTDQILQRNVESEKFNEKKIRNRLICNTNCAPSDSVTQAICEDNYMQQQNDVSAIIEIKDEQVIVNNIHSGNNSLSSVFSSPLQSFRSVLGFGNIFSWSKRGIDA
ncbi:16011_t:CDS:2 [Funneliformis geosporum]|uniref:3057_t:CDS:1 n=1 Tax=Funneliformis geosporum TaxID=1117311 RepID=A0A9W4WMW2_9GLOM|nr:16011_t:CDS:2 [Funneliformis geosporum]CAI2165809.1 3057_t:CDS:2 [Funneliformis geosporum]